MRKYDDPPFEVCKTCQYFEAGCWCAPDWLPEWCPAKTILKVLQKKK